MRLFTRIFTVLALPMTLASGAAALPFSHTPADLSGRIYQKENADVFTNARSQAISRANEVLEKNTPARFRAAEDESVKPFLSLGPTHLTGDLDAPNGETWYYTGVLTYDTIPAYGEIVYDDYILKEYSFEIYNARLEHVGTLRDKMVYSESETRVARCELAPIVTRHFFNDDDHYELLVGLTVNAEVGYNHYRTIVYSLGGEKKDGYNVPIANVDQLLGDVTQAPSANGEENFYLTFIEDYYPSDEDIEGDDVTFWDYLCQARLDLTVFGKANGTDGPRKLLSKSIPLMNMPGDQQSAPFMISLSHGNDTYFVISQYADTFFNPYYDPIQEDVTMRTDNKLIVEFYKVSPVKIELDYTTEIPFSKDAVDETLASYYSIGSMRYREDINFDDYGTPAGRAALIVTKDNYVVGSDDSYISSYYVYNPDGTLYGTIFEDSESTLSLSDVPGHERQQMFVKEDPATFSYDFYMVDLVSCKNVLWVSNQFDTDSDIETLTANLDRCADGDSYHYAVELRVPAVDENDNDIMRVMWFDKDGFYERIDEINMGTSVQYAQCYINAEALSPTAFNDDAHHEYMLLIKRGVAGIATREELLIGQAKNADAPDGKDLLLVGPDSRGILNGIIPMVNDKYPALRIFFYNTLTGEYAQDFYALPLGSEWSSTPSITVSGADAGSIRVDGTTAYADGPVYVFNPAGAMVARGNGSADLSGLASGMYLIRSSGSTLKLFIK